MYTAQFKTNHIIEQIILNSCRRYRFLDCYQTMSRFERQRVNEVLRQKMVTQIEPLVLD